MTAITAGNQHFGRRLVDVLQTLLHKLSIALDQYGKTRVHHTASRSQLRRAQRDIIQIRQAMRRGNSGAANATKETESVADQ
jgi:hypothetical protein